MRLSMIISLEDVLMANTILSFAETHMPKAIGELGKSRHSEASNKIMQALYATREPLDTQALWKVVSNDMEKIADLGGLLSSLQQADKIQVATDSSGRPLGYLAKQKAMSRTQSFTNFNLLSGKEFPK
jgi:hypothetical protein